MQKILLGYVRSSASLSKEDVCRLTHIQLAFGRLRSDGSIHTDGVSALISQMPQLRAWNPDLRISLSLIPDAGDTAAFTRICADHALRLAFAESCVRAVEDLHLDGVDLDWEFPCVPYYGAEASPQDRDHFTETLRILRKALDQLPGPHRLLTIASGADVYYTRCVDLPAISREVDFINVMTYDLRCGFHALTGHHTPLYANACDFFQNSCDQALRLFAACGVPREKLLLGAAFYSRKWENIPDRRHGLLVPAKSGAAYGPMWDELEKHYLNQNGYVYYWDDEAKAPYLFNGSTFLTFDDPASLREKCRYVLKEGYGGIFYWEHSCDSTGRLLGTLYACLKD